MRPDLLCLRCGLLLVVMSGVGVDSMARADTIKLSGSVVGSGSDKTDDDHAKGYSGDYDVTFDYTIAIKKNPDGTFAFDPTGMSTVKLTDTSMKFGSFTTLPIKITSAAVSPTDGSVTSFDFSSTDWYPNAATDGITNNGLSGTIKIKDGVATVTSSYVDASSGSIYTYKFTAVPEPPGWAMALTGVGMVWAWSFWRRRVSGVGWKV
jgi:hypothetical protein